MEWIGVVDDVGNRAHVTPANVNTILGASGAPPLYFACVTGNINSVRALIAMGANVNGKTVDDYPMIHATGSMADILRVLLEAGAHADATGQSPSTQLFLLVRYRNKDRIGECCRLLIEYGAVDPPRCDYEEIKRIWEWRSERQRCRDASLALASLKCVACPLDWVKGQDVNILRLIAKHVWSTRLTDHWEKREREKEKRNKN